MIFRARLAPAFLLTLVGCDRAPEGAAPAPAALAPAVAEPAMVPQPAPAPERKAVENQLTAIRAAKVSVIALNRVKDFDAYRIQFDSQEPARRAAGVAAHLLSRPVDDPTRVIVHFAAESKEKVDAFLRSPELDELLDAENAPASSLLWIGDNALVDLPEVPLRQSYSLYLKTPVADFSKLQGELSVAVAGFRAQGLGMLALLRSTLDPKLAFLHLTASDRASLETIYSSPAFQKALGDAGAAERKPILADDVR